MAHVSTISVGDVLCGPEQEKIGSITDVIYDPNTLQPMWYEVKVGTFGGKHLVPVGQVALDSDRPAVPYGKDRVKTAPETTGAMPLDEERVSLYEHYQWHPDTPPRAR
jgi:hypothetical protein